MPFSSTTDLNSWFAVCLIEYWEGLNSDGGDDAKEFRDRVIEDPKAEGLAMLIDHHDLPGTFVSAILNTVDWDYVLECFVEDTDDWEPQTRKCYKCFGIYTHESEEAEKDDSGYCEICIEKMDAEDES